MSGVINTSNTPLRTKLDDMANIQYANEDAIGAGKNRLGSLVEVLTPLEIQELKMSDGERQSQSANEKAALAIKSELDIRNKAGLVNTIRHNTTPEDLFIYFIIVNFAIFFGSQVRMNLGSVVALCAALFAIYWMIERKSATKNAELKAMEIKMYEIKPSVNFMFMDSEAIHLIHGAMEFREWSPMVWDKAVKELDAFFEQAYKMETIDFANCTNQVDLLRDLMTKTLNQFKSIIFKTPIIRVAKEQFIEVLKKLHLILQFHLDKAIDNCNVSTHHGTHIYKNHPSGSDKLHEANYGMF